MSIHQHGTIEDTMYSWFGANDTSGSGGDGASAVYDVRLAGAAAGAAPVLSGSATLLSHANFPAGAYEVAIAATVANGFAANLTYSVFATLAVDSQNPTGFVGSFTLTPLATEAQVSVIGTGATGGTHVEATYDNVTRHDIASGNPAVDKGEGLVGIPVTGHSFVVGREVTIANTVNYDGAYEIISESANEVVITATFVAEPFFSGDTIVSSIKGEIFVGTITDGTFADTSAQQGDVHSMDDDGDIIDIIYGFNIGGSRQATSVSIFTNLDGNTDEMSIEGYDFVASQWESRKILSGSGGNSFVLLEPKFVSRHTGTGTEIGDVFVRFRTVTSSPNSLAVDECLLTAVGTNIPTGYPNGYEISAAGTSGTEFNVNGTAGNPCPFADAVTMNNAVALNLFNVHNGETVQLLGNSDGYSFTGETWSLELQGESIANMYTRGAHVSGTSTGSGSSFHNCDINTVTIAPCAIIASRFLSKTGGGFTMQTAGNYLIQACGSRVPGNDSPVFTFPATGNTFVSDRAGSGGRQYENMSAGDLATVEGWGQFIEGTCSGGSVTIRGCLTVAGITNITLTDEARFDVAQVVDGLLDEVNTAASHNVPTSVGRQIRQTSSNILGPFTVASATANTITLDADGDLSEVDGSYDPARILVESGTGVDQTGTIVEYFGGAGNGNGARTLIIRENMKVTLANDSAIFIIASDGRPSTNQGQLRAGSTTTATLNSLAPNADIAGQTLHFTAGTGQDQVALIESYAEPIATFQAIDVAVDATTSYELLPQGCANVEQINNDAQSAADLKDFVDAGYDPGTNKVLGLSTAGLAEIAAQVLIQSVEGTAEDHANTGAVKTVASLILALKHADTTTNPGFLTIFKVDGTELAQLPLVSNAAADPITGVG